MRKRDAGQVDSKLSVRIDRALLLRLKERCARRDIRMQEAVREAVELWIKRA